MWPGRSALSYRCELHSKCLERTGQRRNRKPRSCLLQRSHGLEHNARPGLCMDCAKPGLRNEPRRSSHHASPRTAGHMSAFDASQGSLHWKQRIASRTHRGTINLPSSLLNAHPASGSPGRQEDIFLRMCCEPECLQTAVFLGVRVGEREQANTGLFIVLHGRRCSSPHGAAHVSPKQSHKERKSLAWLLPAT